MKSLEVIVPSIKEPIRPSPGFAKKELSDYKLDIMSLCGFGCLYCSSNSGNHLRINRKPFAEHARQQLGRPLTPADDPRLTYTWPDILGKLEAQLDRVDRSWRAGQTIVFSMLTDGFSPLMLRRGITAKSLQLLLKRTSFRIRILTKNAIVGSPDWIRFFAQHPRRFVVGLSTGTMDDAWAKRVEIGTSLPSARLRAIRQLQAAGIPTYGMLCPIFPDVLRYGKLEQLADAVNPAAVEHVWAEPFNDRANWRAVRDGYRHEDSGYEWFTNVYERSQRELWSQYAAELYTRLKTKARTEGWLDKLRFLLYELDIEPEQAKAFRGLHGVLLQSEPGPNGLSCNPVIADLQRSLPTGRRAYAHRPRRR